MQGRSMGRRHTRQAAEIEISFSACLHCKQAVYNVFEKQSERVCEPEGIGKRGS